MGLTLSWIAIAGIGKAEALGRLGLEDSGDPAEFWQRRAQTCAELPNGRVLLARGEIDAFSAAEIAALSQDTRLRRPGEPDPPPKRSWLARLLGRG